MAIVGGIGEFGMIAHLKRRLPSKAYVRFGVGDDTAVLRCGHKGLMLLASDMLIEGVHFRRNRTPARWIGWKAAACNVSDVAAMGGDPKACVVSLGLPRTTPVRFVDGLYKGLAQCAKRCGFAIVGGDTVKAPCVVIDVAILGTVHPRHLVLRSGARKGDVLCVTGRLGGALESGRHARFVPRLKESQWLVRHIPIHAMIDLSDGLSSDIWQIARASDVALQIDSWRIPLSKKAKSIQHALTDGEDFELLFALSKRAAEKIPRRIGACPVTRIGKVLGRGAKVELKDANGKTHLLRPRGFRHF